MVKHIIYNVCPNITEEKEGRAWWMGTPYGKFLVKSAWEYVMNKKYVKEIYKYI